MMMDWHLLCLLMRFGLLGRYWTVCLLTCIILLCSFVVLDGVSVHFFVLVLVICTVWWLLGMFYFLYTIFILIILILLVIMIVKVYL